MKKAISKKSGQEAKLRHALLTAAAMHPPHPEKHDGNIVPFTLRLPKEAAFLPHIACWIGGRHFRSAHLLWSILNKSEHVPELIEGFVQEPADLTKLLTSDSHWCRRTPDAQLLLDPFEEQFDLPPAFVELGDGESVEGEIRFVDR